MLLHFLSSQTKHANNVKLKNISSLLSLMGRDLETRRVSIQTVLRFKINDEKQRVEIVTLITGVTESRQVSRPRRTVWGLRRNFLGHCHWTRHRLLEIIIRFFNVFSMFFEAQTLCGCVTYYCGKPITSDLNFFRGPFKTYFYSNLFKTSQILSP